MSSSSSRRRLTDLIPSFPTHRWYSSVFMVDDAAEDEREQLINSHSTFRTSCCEKLWLIILALILLVGVTASTYLLIVEGKDPVPKKFTLVPRAEWTRTKINCTDSQKIQLPFQRIVLLPTNTSECGEPSECLASLKSLQKLYAENVNSTGVPYSYIVAGDDRIYEDRGFQCPALFDSDGVQLFTIGFFGKYDDRRPSEDQIRSLEVFLEDSISKGRISPCYLILSRYSTYINDVGIRLNSNREKNIC